jgi:uncharacterized protein (TIGR03000 family)
MYSMVLMAALTTGTSAPDCWFHNHGCNGGCYGGGACYGGGCYGGCYGGSCYGRSYGCYGSYAYGCYGCSGGYGCWGASYGCHGSYACHGCYGCWGCYGCYGGTIISPYMMTPASPPREPLPPPKKDGSDESKAQTRARLIVELPSEATLYIDDQKMNTTSSRRVFNTPELERGETYYYILRAEVVREGSPVTVTKRVIVKPGEEIRADFRDLAAPSVTTVKVP